MRKNKKIKKLPDFGDNQSGQIKQVFLWNTKRNFINICKTYLIALEQMKVDHRIFLDKLENEVDPELLKKMDYLSEEKYNYIRKQILDAGNDAFRDVENFTDKLDIELKKEKGQHE
ncbi:MAG: hypothetical protein H8E05_01235 [Bacteroidetes bacterium]|nr:hypothetical protein [Bacteroidota bacterium]